MVQYFTLLSSINDYLLTSSLLIRFLQQIKVFMKYLILVLLLSHFLCKDSQKLTKSLNQYTANNGIMGMTLEISQNSSTIYKFNYGLKDYERNLTIDNNTLFRMASLSKSPTSVGILQQVEKGKLNLQEDISNLLGFEVINPFFPNHKITVEMILSHQSSFMECDAYYNFLHDTYTGPPFPSIKQLLSKGGKYYNSCLFNSVYPPGKYYEYVNYNFAIGATILQRVSGQRFDIYSHSNIFNPLQMNSTSYKRQDFVNRANDISVLYRTDSNKKWVPQADNWKGNISLRDLTKYQVGTNGAVFSPMGGLYSTSSDLTRYTNMLRSGGSLGNTKILNPESCKQMLRPRFQYNGKNKAQNSSEKSYNAYGLGIQTSTYRLYDKIFPNIVVRGHWGDSYGLISELEFTSNYTFMYAINGAYNGYHDVDWSFYEKQRIQLHEAVYKYLYQ